MHPGLAAVAGALALAAVGCAPRVGRLGGAPPAAPIRSAVAAPTAPREEPPSARLQALTPEPPPPLPGPRWKATHAGLESADTQECLGCHGGAMGDHSHPVGVVYADAAGRRPGGTFRPLEQVRARGIALPGGKVGCRTCHSPASPWARFLAVPRELARPRAALDDLRAEKTSREAAGPATAPAEGAEVSHRPLCESCHAF
ncbi:MAG TPA: hypothetical protein VLS93_16290 [Anaeromyxobacteraceae bacterium]|nr:hypothetical protein [Anaeromyxobacteraceae bacterium]